MNGNHQSGGVNYYAGGGAVGMENDYAKEKGEKKRQTNGRCK